MTVVLAKDTQKQLAEAKAANAAPQQEAGRESPFDIWRRRDEVAMKENKEKENTSENAYFF